MWSTTTTAWQHLAQIPADCRPATASERVDGPGDGAHQCRADQELAARLLIDRDISTLPVEDQGQLVGIFHVDDAADILELESTEDAEMQGGSSPLDTPYLQATPGNCGASGWAGC